jgi:hypothetical protein
MTKKQPKVENEGERLQLNLSLAAHLARPKRTERMAQRLCGSGFLALIERILPFDTTEHALHSPA